MTDMLFQNPTVNKQMTCSIIKVQQGLTLWKDVKIVLVEAIGTTHYITMRVVFGVKKMKAHQKVFKLLSVLLQYPEREWIKEIPMMALEIEQLNDTYLQKNFTAFFDYLKHTEFDQLCENYVNTFDYHGIVTLHLTYNVFKDSRKRGEALIELQRLYKKVDLEKTYAELPDYLPLILEFLAIVESE